MYGLEQRVASVTPSTTVTTAATIALALALGVASGSASAQVAYRQLGNATTRVQPVTLHRPPVTYTKGCNFGANNSLHPVGDIGTVYDRMGGAVGSGLGCPLTPEVNAGDGAGRIQTFEHGQISWSPDRGQHPVLVARQAGNTVELMWAGVQPYHYDFWIVRTDRDGVNIDQRDIKVGPSDGYFVLRNALPGATYSFVVEGCDEMDVTGRKARCRQGWLRRVTVPMKPNPLLAGSVFNDPPARGTSCFIDAKCVTDAVKDGLAVVGAVVALL